MFNNLIKKGFIGKRMDHVSDRFLEWLEKKEVDVYNQIVSHDAIKLNPINKKKIIFPQDIYPGKDVPLEWWYFTGHLEDKKNKQKFGFEFCIFKFHPSSIRVGIFPLSFVKKEPFLALHFAITDKNKKTFKIFQDSSLLHPQKIDYQKLNLTLNDATLKYDHTFSIATKNEVADLKLDLLPLKKLVKHFDHGFTVMYPHPKHQTYYLTFTRLKTKGELKINNRKYQVSGLSWFDHQKMNVPKNSSLRGWDWFSIILDDNTELMFFVLRNKRGLTHKFMGGTYVKADSKIINLASKDVQINAISQWLSKETGINYPSGWHMTIPRLNLNLKIMPAVKNQEITKVTTTPINYWEGACDVIGTHENKKVKGQSYVELVGYDHKLTTKITQSFFR